MGRKNNEGTQIVQKMQERFPKFSKITLCMIRNPEYGVDFSAAAKRHMRPKVPKEAKPVQKKLTIRMSDDEYLNVQAAMLKNGCKTYRELIEKALGNLEGK